MKTHYNCLIIDDEIELAETTAEYFEMFDVSAVYAKDASEGLKLLDSCDIDLLLLDINLGDEDGFLLCKEIRKNKNLPILFISARGSEDDILRGLSVGGDDYIQKPYSLSVLLAKVKVMLKRMATVRDIKDEISENENGISLNSATMSVIVDGKSIPLKAKEFALLSCLYAHKGEIVDKQTLFNEVWGDGFYSDGTLNVHIRRLREKLEEDANNPKLIETIWGTGYKFM